MDDVVRIGQSIRVKGELTGKEDLVIDGNVEGKVSLEQHSLTVGASGKITADIRAKDVVVVGRVRDRHEARGRQERDLRRESDRILTVRFSNCARGS